MSAHDPPVPPTDAATLRAANVAHQIIETHISRMLEVEMPWAVHPVAEAGHATHAQDIGRCQV